MSGSTRFLISLTGLHTKEAAVIKTIHPTEAVNPDHLKTLAETWLDADKAENILTIDLRGQSALADYIIIATGGNTRHVTALASKLRDRMKENGVRDVRVEGTGVGDWIVVDAGDIIVHIFRPEVREFYGIEEMWTLPTATGNGSATLHAL